MSKLYTTLEQTLSTEEISDFLKEFFGEEADNYAFTDVSLGKAKPINGKLAYHVAYHIGPKDILEGLQRSFPLQTLISEVGKLASLNHIQIYFTNETNLLSILKSGDSYVAHNTPHEITEHTVAFSAKVQTGDTINTFAEKWVGSCDKKCTAMVAEMPDRLPPKVLVGGVSEGVEPSPFKLSVTETENNFTQEQLDSVKGDINGESLVGRIIDGTVAIAKTVTESTHPDSDVTVKSVVNDNGVIAVDIEAKERPVTELIEIKVTYATSGYAIGRHQEGITINPLEYVLNDDGSVKYLPSEEAAKDFAVSIGLNPEAVVIKHFPEGGLQHVSLEHTVTK